MSNWYCLFNRSILKPKRYNIGCAIECFVRNRGTFGVANECGKNSILCASVLQKVQSSSYATMNHLRLDGDNILTSALEDLDIPRELVHEYVWKNLDRWPDRIATVCSTTGKFYTYSQLRTLSGRFASSLRKCKLYPGSTIALVLPNVPEYAIVILGASEAGVKVTMCNPISTVKEIRRQLEDSEASAVVTTPEQYSAVKDSISGNENIKLPIIVIVDDDDAPPHGSIRFYELISASIELFDESSIPDRNIEDTMFLPYSSGTTGFPKGVEVSHRNVTTNCEQVQTQELFLGYSTTETHQDVIPMIVPVFHIYGLVVVLINGLSIGAKLVFLRKFTPASALECLKDSKPTVLFLVPPLVMFLGNSETISRNHLATVRVFVSAAAPIGTESIRKLLTKATLKAGFIQGYGLTETCGTISLGVKGSGLDNSKTVGILHPNTKLRIVGVTDSDAGRNMGVNETGELYVKGPQVMKGYHKNPEATRNTMDGEWLKTGDLGCFDENGHILIKDRLKELIKVKGFQVAPAELEELLLSNDGILDAAVTAEPHARYGEIPKAFIVRQPGSKLNEEAVKNFVAERVSCYKQLGLVEFVDAIPKSLSGKILRRQLKSKCHQDNDSERIKKYAP